ncbi:MAG: hypothetical protein FJ386_02525 [Verrucomicrobia bacterium]|nr:hypothetical protein [Verrucomicrobiota bacterium]
MTERQKVDDVIAQLEAHVERWKNFNRFINKARARQSSEDDEMAFLECKSVILQELEVICAAFESGAPNKDDIRAIINNAPSIRSMGEMNDNSLRALESSWHKVFGDWQTILGQLKVRQRQMASESSGFFGKLFGKR